MSKRIQTTKIILHCSATREGHDIKASTIKQWHKQRGFNDIGYHYIIDLDGKIETGRNESLVGAHCTGQNSVSIGICYIGGCDKNMNPKDTRTHEQKKSLLDIVNKMMTKYNIPLNQVYCHNQFSNKACPSFSINTFRNEYVKAFNL